MKKINLIMVLIAFTNTISAQNIGIGTTTPNASAILEIKAGNKGLLIPRTSSSSRTAIVNPAKGLMVYDTTTSSFWFYNSSAWVQISAGSSAWALTGNAGTNPAANFIGTTDAQPLMFKVNDEKSGSIDYNAFKANTAFGYKSLFSNTGNYNTASGYAALYSNTSGYSNVAIGIRALFSNTIQRHVVAVGDSALFNNGINAVNSFHAERNTAVGSKALYANTNGYSNTAIGYLTLFSNTTGIRNMAIGAWSLYYNSTGSYNTAVGESLVSNTTGSYNTASGTWSLYENTTGFSNTANGAYSLYSNTSGVRNTAIGDSSLFSNTTADGSTAIGYQSLYRNTIGSSNTAVGYESMTSNTTGYSNTASGHESLRSNISGRGNTANGDSSLYSNTVGTDNVAMGRFSLFSNTGGYYNSALGAYSLYSNQAGSLSTNGYYNTACGAFSLRLNTTGQGNTGVGLNALYDNKTGINNTAIGTNAGVSEENLHNATAIGYQATVDASNKIRIGDFNITSIGGKVGWSTFSDRKYKKDIKENVPGLAFINILRPVTYTVDVKELNGHYNKLRKQFAISLDEVSNMEMKKGEEEASKIVHNGFIAQEVETAAKKLNYKFSGIDNPKTPDGLYALRYAEFVVPLVKAVQEQQQQIDTLKKENAEIREQLLLLEQLRKELGSLKKTKK